MNMDSAYESCKYIYILKTMYYQLAKESKNKTVKLEFAVFPTKFLANK